MARLILLFSIVISLLFFTEILSGQVSADEAAKLAKNFFTQKSLGVNPQVKDAVITRHFAKIEHGKPLYHIFNFGQGGFVITSPDKRFIPVLAWSPIGEFDLNSVPENCAVWLDWYEVQIKKGMANPENLTGETSGLWEHYLKGFEIKDTKGVAPLLTVKWNQGKFYNALCPADPGGYDDHVPVGCVATAMAQLMFYYRFPYQGNGSHSYIPPYNNGTYGLQFADFGNTFYQWNEMTDECFTYNTAVAELSYHCAVAVNMKFSPSSSGANVSDIAPALSDYFNYLPNAQLMLRQSNGGYEAWRQMLTSHLENNQPVLYFSSSGYVGHAYICDGFQDSVYFHFNWGWSGNHNGYYYIDELIPGGIDLSQNQGGIFNIYPDTTLFEYPAHCQEGKLLSASEGSLSDGSGPLNYQSETSCSWLIKPDDPEMTNLRLDFSMFDLATENDSLFIYDGENYLAPLLGSFTGNLLPPVIVSTQPSLYLSFNSADTITGKGFQANYHAFSLPFCDGFTVITSPEGYLNDGSDFFNYSNGIDCSWLLAPEVPLYDSVEKMHIRFTGFSLASGDTLFIHDGIDYASPLLASLSGNDTPPEFTSSGQNLFLNFHTNESDSTSGWEINYTPVPPVYCSDTLFLNVPDGTIEDGSSNKHYNSNTNCFWHIQIPGTELITIEFTKVDMELNYDYVLIRDLNKPYSAPVRVTGNTIPPPITISSNKILISFFTDQRDNHYGWELKYHASAELVSEQAIHPFVIYPNPVSDRLIIRQKIETSLITYRIFNMHGTVQSAGEGTENEVVVNMHFFKNGIYLIEIQIENQIFHRKIVKL
ncbi:MAG: C10 family peptidase [Bacteroidales bacterium]|nr:C10 family peptidase [Bacteroidales bacterium]